MEKKIIFLSKQIIFGILDTLVIVLFFSLLLAIFIYYNTPDVAGRMDGSVSGTAETTVIYDRTGKIILYKIFGEENRKIISHEEIPDVVRMATLAAEDDSFYNHIGVDPKAIVRAVRVNAANASIEQGASTITQQLARILYLDREKTYERKIKEAVLAMKLEKKYSKDEILDMYLNQIPYGSNAYGIQAAAETFFKKDAENLTLDEAALLAALPKATTTFSPYGNNKDRLIIRQRYVLDRVESLGFASKETIKEAKAVDVYAKIQPLKHEIKAPHFVFYVLEQLERNYSREKLEKGGLQIITSLDWEMQQRAEEIVKEGAIRNEPYGASNAALVALDPRSGQILAMVGSRDYFSADIDGQVNVTNRIRQPGSAFKPIVYAKAFEKGYQPETLVYDVRTNFGPDGSGRSYIPRNYDGGFRGLISMRQSLSMSLNIPAVKALSLAGVGETLDLARRMGYTTLSDKYNYGLSLALGGGGITLLENTAAFAIFANEGKRNPIAPVISIMDKQGDVLYLFEKKEQDVLDIQVARKINSILSDNKARTPVFGPNSPLHIPGKTVAAKTGTSQYFKDGWTVGYIPDLAVGVWVGNNDSRPLKNGADGVFVAAPIWNKFMQEFMDSYPVAEFVDYKREKSIVPIVEDKKVIGISYYKKAEDVSYEEMFKPIAETEKGINAGDNMSKNNIDDCLPGKIELNFRAPLLGEELFFRK